MFQESIPFKALHCCQIIQSKVDIQRRYFSGYHESQQSLHLYPPPLLSPPLPLWHQPPFLPTASFSCFHVLWVFCMCDYIYKKIYKSQMREKVIFVCKHLVFLFNVKISNCIYFPGKGMIYPIFVTKYKAIVYVHRIYSCANLLVDTKVNSLT